MAKRLKPAAGPGAAAVKELIAGLDDPAFAKREAAQRRLAELATAGELAEPVVQNARDSAMSEEVRRRLDTVMDQIRPIPKLDADRLRDLRCIEILEYANSRDVLRKMAGGDQHSPVTRDAGRALDRLAGR